MSSKPSDDIIYGRRALTHGEPWIVPESFTYLKSIARPTWAVFEWGAGGSTVWFASNCGVVTTIEQSQKWHKDIKGKVARAGGCSSIRYIPIAANNNNYADAILEFQDNTFDMVFVDGEVTKRDRCLANTWAKVAYGGYVMLDNSNWWKGELPDTWTRVDFMETGLRWVGEAKPFDWATSFFRRGMSCT